jgi:imidazolonepropionase-like amidohydrolase
VLLNGNGSIVDGVDVFIHKGIFKEIGVALSLTEAALSVGISPEKVLILDVKGRWVTPGIVDMHSHAGTDCTSFLINSRSLAWIASYF